MKTNSNAFALRAAGRTDDLVSSNSKPQDVHLFPTRVMRSVKSLSTEDIFLTVAIYAAFVAFHFDILSPLTFFFLVLFYVVRVFNIRHEKAHLPPRAFTQTWMRIAEVCWVFHTPYQEPFQEKRRKHLAHHRSHIVNQKNSLETHQDPHRLLEGPGWLNALICSVFYEEVMFYQDWKLNNGLSESRKRMLIIASASLALLLLLFGAASLLSFVLFYRASMAIAWFSFSYALHIDDLYDSPVMHKFPWWVSRGLDAVLGAGAATALLYHRFHHEHPLHYHVPKRPESAGRLSQMSARSL